MPAPSVARGHGIDGARIPIREHGHAPRLPDPGSLLLQWGERAREHGHQGAHVETMTSSIATSMPADGPAIWSLTIASVTVPLALVWNPKLMRS